MKKLFAIVALAVACSFGATSTVMAQEDVAQEEIPSGNVSLRVWGDGEDAELLAQMVESFQTIHIEEYLRVPEQKRIEPYASYNCFLVLHHAFGNKI